MKNRNTIFTTILLALACFGLLPAAQAITPAPDGGYPGFNTAEGQSVLLRLDTSTGIANTAVGWSALSSNVDASFNTALGAGALLANTSANSTALGAGALLSNTIGEENTATGAFALFSNTEGDFNTANGSFALSGNTTGERNTATGDSALYSNTTGNLNTAIGNAALVRNNGSYNTAIGALALQNNTAGLVNTAIGYQALRNNTTGGSNTASGNNALFSNTSGVNNTAIGVDALRNNVTANYNTAIGYQALFAHTTGDFNIALGFGAGENLTNGHDNIYIGHGGAAFDSDTIRIGGGGQTSAFIGGIFGQSSFDGVPVLISSAGKLGTTTSSRRFKDEIKAMDNASEAILALKPVTFHYKSDAKDTPQFGLIAEEVAAINSDLVVRDADGQIYTVRYEAINAMLLNEFLKEHRKVQEQHATIAQLQAAAAKQEAINAEQRKGMRALTAMVKEQASQIQKVSAQLEMSRPAPQTVLNNQ